MPEKPPQMIRAAKNALGLIFGAIFEFVKPALIVSLLIVVCAALIAGVGGAAVENWGSIVCWVNDETGNLGRTCALHKIAESKEYDGAEVIEVTGIGEISENLKRVEFKWRPKPNAQNPNPHLVDGIVTFRKYDDGWRPSE